MGNKHHDLGERVQALTMIALGYSIATIVAFLTFSKSQLYKIRAKAIARGYNPIASSVILLEFVTDAPRIERPTKIAPRLESQVIAAITRDRYGKEKTAEQLGHEFNVSKYTILRILHRKGFRKCKPSRKPGLTIVMRSARLLFALKYQHWTLED